MKAVTSMLTMSPSWITVESGMPWQMTSLSEVQQRLREALVAQRRRVGAVVAHELMGDPVEFVRRDARRDCLTRLLQCLRSDLAGDAHLFDGLWSLNPRLVALVDLLLPDIFRTLDRGGNRPDIGQRSGGKTLTHWHADKPNPRQIQER